MSRDRKRERVHRAVVKARIDQTAYEQSPLGTLERKKAEYDAHNDALRFWLGRYLEEVLPDPGQPPDTMLGSKIGLKKGAGVSEPLLFARITKAVPLDDGSLEVHGIASSEDRDDQNEVVKAEAIRAALPDYLQFPAVRMQHRADMPIGTTLEVDVGQDKVTRVVTKIVDRDAITKVRAGVLRGFSLGGSVTQRDPGDPTVITGLRLLELSLCDRPANPTAKVTLFKADMPEPVPSWHCGEHSHHQTQVEAALCRVRRELGKNGGAGVSSFEEFRCGY